VERFLRGRLSTTRYQLSGSKNNDNAVVLRALRFAERRKAKRDFSLRGLRSK